MARKDKIVMAKQTGIKRLRNAVRTEYAIKADIALNDLLPEFEDEFDRRLATGESLELTSYAEWVEDTVKQLTARG